MNKLKRFLKSFGFGIIVASLLTSGVAYADRSWSPPDQTGHAGQFLQTDGVNTLWATAGGGGTITSITAGTGITLSTNPCTSTCTISAAGAVSSLNEYSITVTGSTYNATNRAGTFTSSSSSLDTVWTATITDSSTNPASITFGAGNFVTISGLQVGRGNISIRGQGIGVTNIQGQAASTALNTTPIFQDVPSQSSVARTLTVDANIGDQTMTMSPSDAATFAVGDYILLTSNLSIDTEIAGRNQGEIHQLTGVNGATGVLTIGASGTGTHVYQTMTVANGANVRKLNMYTNVSITGITFTDLATSRPNTLGVGQTLFEFIVGLNIQNCQFYKMFNSGTQIYQTLNANVVDNNFKIIQDTTPTQNTYYGVQVRGASNGIAIVGNTFQQMRHAVTQGAGSGTYLMGTTRDLTISGNTSADTTTAHFDLHQGAEGVTISSNTMTGDDGSANGIQSRSPVTITGNSIIGIVGTGISIFGNGSGSIISGNDIKGATTGIQLSNGVSNVNITGNNIRNGGTGMSLNRLSTTVTISIASPAVITDAAHSIPVGTEVTFGTTGALPTGLSTGTNYYVIQEGITPNSFEVSTTVGGSAVNTSGSQSGVQTLRYYSGTGSVITGNYISGNSSDGLFMNGQRNVKINNNTFTGNNRSITMNDTDSHSTGLVVTNNYSYGNIASNFPAILGTGTIVSGNNGFGGLSQIVTAGANAIGLSITQNDTTNNPRAVTIANSGTANSLLITPTGNTSASVSTGGAFNITNTGNTGPAAVIYSNNATPSGRLFIVNADNVAFNQTAARIINNGTGNAADIVNTNVAGGGAGGRGLAVNTDAGGGSTNGAHALDIAVTGTGNTNSSAINAVSSNSASSTIQISGVETGRGTIKLTHTGTGTDGNAAGISVDLQGTGTAAQGIFMTSTTGGTTGALMELRNNLAVFGGANAQVSLFTLLGNGHIGLLNASPTAWLHLPAGTATASTAPLKFTAGTNLATTEAGAIEYDGSHLYFTATNAGTRYQLDQQAGTTYSAGSGISLTGSTFSIDLTSANIFTALQSVNKTGLGASTVDALFVENTTAAVNGTQQISPSIHWSGLGFGTTAGTSQDVSFRANVLPTQGTVPTGTWQLQSSIAGGGFANQLQVTSGGAVTSTGALSSAAASTSVSYQSSTTFANSDFAVLTTGSNTQTNAALLFAGGSTIAYRAVMIGSTAATPATAIPYGSFIIGSNSVTIPTGTTSLAAQEVINPLTITATGTLTNSASLFINGAASGATNNYALMVNSGNSFFGGLITTYNGIATAGNGVVSVQGAGRQTAQTSADASVTSYTVGASDASFDVSANILVTTATLHNFTATVTYTDEGNTSRTVTLQFSTVAGAFVTAITNAQGAVPYEGVPIHIRAKASTAITIATTGTFTTVTYNVEGIITKLQ